MGTISERRRADGSIAHRVEIVIRKDGKRHKVTKTFDSRPSAERWMRRKEKELRAPGGMERLIAPGRTLAQAIDRYISDNAHIGKTKGQVLAAIKTDEIADMDCARIRSDDIVDYARRLGDTRQPQTVMNYLSHLSAVFNLARPAYGIPLDYQAIRDAQIVCKRLGLTQKSSKRERRPTTDEMNALMAHFEQRHLQRGTIPMHVLAAFAMFSTRRQDEICRIARADYEPEAGRVLVRDMKNPGEKRGNDVWCSLPPEAQAILDRHSAVEGQLFPYKSASVSAAWTRACKLLGIEDLTFHDLRHEGCSRLHEMGWTPPQVATVSGHRSWSSLQRYSHLRATGDRWAGWIWMEKLLGLPPASG